jgi:protein TonB
MLLLDTEPRPHEVRRWILAALAILALHAGAAAAVLGWSIGAAAPGTATPTVLIDLAPQSAAPATELLDLAPGPAMQQAAPTAEPPDRRAVEDAIAPTPIQPIPPVTLPPERKPIAQLPRPIPPRETAHRHDAHTPAPRTAAPPRSDLHAAVQTAAIAGAAVAAATASYRAQLVAHLQRYKTYPAAARSAGETGVTVVAFTVGRGGELLGSRITRSSGHAALDAETLALLRRAQPLPAFPTDLRATTLSFDVPMAYALR